MNVACRNLYLTSLLATLTLTSCGGGASKESGDFVKLQGAGASFPAPGVPRQLKTGAGATPAKRIPSSGMLTTRDPEHAASVRAAATMWSKFWSATLYRTCLGGGRTPDLV